MLTAKLSLRHYEKSTFYEKISKNLLATIFNISKILEVKKYALNVLKRT